MKYNYSLLIVFIVILVKFSSAQSDIQAYVMMSDSLILEKSQETKPDNLDKLQLKSFDEPELTPCNYFNPSTDYNNGYPSSTGGGGVSSQQVVAADVIVPIDQDFTLSTIDVSMWTYFTALGLDSAEIIIYKDINGLPDTSNIVQSQSSVIPVSQTFISASASGRTVYDVEFNMGDILLLGQQGTTTKYWISIYFTLQEPNREAIWEFTTTNIQGSSAAVSVNNGLTWQIPGSQNRELVYTFSGDCTQHLGIDDFAIKEFKYFPNPVINGVLELSAKDIIDTVTIYNMLGQNLINRKVGVTNTQIDMSALKAGTYILKVHSKDQIGTYKIIKDN